MEVLCYVEMVRVGKKGWVLLDDKWLYELRCNSGYSQVYADQGRA